MLVTSHSLHLSGRPFGTKLLWEILHADGLIFIAVNEQILKNNLAIWSHCQLRQGAVNKTSRPDKKVVNTTDRFGASVTRKNRQMSIKVAKK